MICTRVAVCLSAFLGVSLLLTLLVLSPLPLLAQAVPTSVPTSVPPAGEQPGDRLFQSPLAPPAAETVTAEATPTLLPTATPTATFSPTPTETPVPTATPSATPTATIAPLQVSPLVAQSGTGLPDDGALLWIGAAALVILAGSAVLVVAERRQNR